MDLAEKFADKFAGRSTERRVLGIAGCPGSGKSSLAAQIVEQLGPRAVVVPMDGFHLSNEVLRQLCRSDRKGSPDTFDVDGYVSLLHRLRASSDQIIYAPEYRREFEESIGSAVSIGPEIRWIVTEGNYLLHDEGGWERVRPLLDECWFVDIDDETRIERLVKRHIVFGKSPEAALAWANGPDERNAEIIRSTRSRADHVLNPSV